MLVALALAAVLASDPVAEPPATVTDHSGALGGAVVGAVVGGIAGTAASVGAGLVLSRFACAAGCTDDPGGFLIFFAPVAGAQGALIGAAAGVFFGHSQDAARAADGRPQRAAVLPALKRHAPGAASSSEEDDETPSSRRAVVQSIAAQCP